MSQDFSRQNLRGRSFKGQNLAGANFSGADIRGADFTGAELTSANFNHAQAGLQHRWIVGLLITSCLLLAISGIFSGYSAYFITLILDRKNAENFSAGLTSLIVVTIFFFTVIRKGLVLGLGAGLASGIIIGAIIGVTTKTGFGAVIGVGVITASVTAIGAFAKAFAVALAMSVAEFIGGFIAVIVAIAASFIAATTVAQAGSFVINGNIPGYVAGAIAVFSSYIGWSAFKKSQEDSWISSFATTFATTRGTSFRNANLTKAKFCQALLKSTDLRSSILIDTCWHKARKINDIRPGITYLKYEQLREVLVTGQGQEKIFDRQDLRGVNLKGANLTDASFIGTELSHANLQEADLSRAKLVQTQLNGTDFTGATLTGAYIEDWNITTNTKFDGVCCEYVYMRLPTTDNPNPHRKPDNRHEVFAPGEFGDFIKPIFDTLDLYHSQGVDPRAIAISFKQLAENHPEADLRIVGMEVRGEDKFLLRAKTAAMTDKSELSAEYFEIYNQLKTLAQQELQALISEKDSRIRSLETMVVTALQSPKFYAQTYSNQGDTMSQSPKKESHFNLQGAQFGGGLVNADTVTAGQIGGNITNYNPEQKQNLAQAAAEIEQLLNQLSQTYPTATTSEKMTVVAKAVDEIESNPTLKARVIGALKAGGTEAFKELIDHPVVNILLASIDGWQDAE
ncbi:hypothetical protein CDG77_10595 [Nostoc sp. 'Peltigera membranacea cyanobiont' 213]|uniref:pentapeptide repeat-containing protein n=1 Tax=Nostoc sp. 'Peltigera membranacea cyanobiont' 213 TaxID=2014530 RepID=UPI000B951318|nr:pentapeptide repeat-containing protein [Nostoc sp. 'Peltigera membranacea cyanobiont' 213]OYD95163.1 hypothetical protein CDG77_10595 [Nostoc sp. 'Peltigera membranacea cyanobiont' 213]